MDYKLAKEIYGNAWFVDPVTFQQLSKSLELAQNNVFNKNSDIERLNNFGILDKSSLYNASMIKRMDVVPQNSIALYNFDSVITKHGGMSHYGTVDIANQFRDMEANEGVIGHIFKIESGGGSANAIKYIREVSAKTNRSKPLVVYAEDIMASAAMYIASDADYIFVNSPEALVGSIGTMIEIEGYKNGTEDSTGKRHLRIYASQSVNKNKEFETAINDLNFELIRSTLLDPHAETFINDMKANRPNIRNIETTGQIFRGSDVVGTLVDGIGSLQDAILKVEELAEITPASGDNNNNNQNIKSMDLNQLRTENPALYAEVFGLGKKAGISAEKQRVEAWAVYYDIDPAKVKAGIEGEGAPTVKDQNEFVLASINGKKVEAMEGENTPPVNIPKEAKTEEEIKAEAQKAEMDELFNEKGE